MNTRRYGLVVCTLLSLLAGCEDEFLTSASINRMRLLGMRVRPDGEPERAWVRPGDSGRVDFSLAFGLPGKDDPERANPLADVKSMMIHCTKAEILDGQPQCAEVIALAVAAQQAIDAGVPDDAGPPVSQEQIDATLMALREGIECGDPNDDERPFKLAQLAISNFPVTTMPARLECPHDAFNNPLRQLFEMPGDYRTLEAGARLGLAQIPERLVQGVVCEYGEPIFKSEPPFFGCRYEVGSNPNLPNRAPIAEVFFYSVGVEQAGQTNHHPLFAVNDPIRRAGLTGTGQAPEPAAWADEPVPATCDGLTTDGPLANFIVDYGAKSNIAVGVSAARETYGMPERKEVYQIEAFVNYGELDRRFSVVDDLDDVVPDGADGDKAVIEVEWEHGEKPVPSRNTLVRFQFLIRDGRGGFVIDDRWLCMCPNRSC